MDWKWGIHHAQRGLSAHQEDLVHPGMTLCPRGRFHAHGEDIVHTRKTMHVWRCLLGKMYIFCTHGSLLATVGVWGGMREL